VKRFGDRKDGKLIRHIEATNFIMPHIFPNRCDNEAYISERIDLEGINKYIAKKNAEGNDDFPYTMFHIIVAALIKTLTLRPKMNRFIANKNYYQRNDVSAAFVVKKQFSDVSEGDWYAPAVNWVVKKGIMSGVTENTFNTNQYITREEFVTALYIYAGKPAAKGNLSEFADNDAVSANARNAVRWAIGKNILQGDSNRCLNPKGYITRAEMAAMLVRYI